MIENTLLQNAKNRFLADEFFMLSWAATVQHNSTWKNLTCKCKQREFRKKVKEKLESMLLEYSSNPVEAEKHLDNIKRLHDFTKDNGEEFDIGKCQKLLNMMCKYYWCMGWICEPPDLPIDGMNLKELTDDEYENLREKLGEKQKINWTECITDEGKYTDIIDAFREHIKADGFSSLAIWELRTWKRKSEQEK